jgi:hypothetical protein
MADGGAGSELSRNWKKTSGEKVVTNRVVSLQLLSSELVAGHVL